MEIVKRKNYRILLLMVIITVLLLLLLILSEIFDTPLEKTIDRCLYRSERSWKISSPMLDWWKGPSCSLELWVKNLKLSQDEIVTICYDYATGFTGEFGSLSCRELRPEGFKPENPPNICKDLAHHSMEYGIQFIKNWINLYQTKEKIG